MNAGLLTLGLPIRQPRLAWGTVALLFVYYALSSSHDLSFYDSAELALVAEQLGLGHPIGQPLHTVLGYLATHIPMVPALVGLTMLSVIPAALALLPMMSIADSLSVEGIDPKSAQWVRAVVVVLYALSWTVWESASRIEVYALAALLSLWALARIAAHVRGLASSTQPAFLRTGIVFGLLGATNAYLAVLATLAVVPLLMRSLRARDLHVRQIGALVLGGAIGLLPYVYIPLVAHRTDVFVWGAPTSGHALFEYMRGADYARNRGISFDAFFAHLGQWAVWAMKSAALPLGALGVAAHLTLGEMRAVGRTTALIFFTATVALLCSHVVFAPDIADYIDYLMPALLLAGAGTAALLGKAWAYNSGTRMIALGVLVLVAFFAAFPLPSIAERSRHRDHAARILAEGALREVPENGILVAAQDHWVAPLLYLQEVEHQRPDVVVLAYGLSSSSWYWDLVYRRHPQLVRSALRGPNGKAGRVVRFLEAQRGRAIFVAEPFVARELNVVVCDVGFAMKVGRMCRGNLATHQATRTLADAMNAIDRGSPSSDSALAEVALARGETLLRLGRPAQALHATLAGIPPSVRPPLHALDVDALVRVPRFDGEMPAWREEAPLGDARRNLMFAAFILGEAGDEVDKAAFVARAAALRLPEALN
jgi:hypothetical protein